MNGGRVLVGATLVAGGLSWRWTRPAPSPSVGSHARGAPDQTLDATAVFGGRTVVSQARPLRSGAVTALFGGIEVKPESPAFHPAPRPAGSPHQQEA